MRRYFTIDNDLIWSLWQIQIDNINGNEIEMGRIEYDP